MDVVLTMWLQDRRSRATGPICRETTRIIREFSGGWYGKTLHREGGFNSVEAARFGHVALKKIVDDGNRHAILTP
ncbi:hypothetical protein [Antarctobacter sp.]|uniref:hypothetical protein n=1 Tax=Antarctobacter sp. TaxID=1872577 RepID=UPI003A8D0EA9